jgi:hypothetical protein
MPDCVCYIEEMDDPHPGDDCPFSAAAEIYTIHTCHSRASGPYCREHAEQILAAIHSEIHV